LKILQKRRRAGVKTNLFSSVLESDVRELEYMEASVCFKQVPRRRRVTGGHLGFPSSAYLLSNRLGGTWCCFVVERGMREAAAAAQGGHCTARKEL
jgi:hypothetical protein